MENILLEYFKNNEIHEYRIVNHSIQPITLTYSEEKIEKNREEILQVILIYFLYDTRLFSLKVNTIDYNTINLIEVLIDLNINKKNYLDFNQKYNNIVPIDKDFNFNIYLDNLKKQIEFREDILYLEQRSFNHVINICSNQGNMTEKNVINYLSFLLKDGRTFQSNVKVVDDCLFKIIEEQSITDINYKEIKDMFESLDRVKFTKQPVMLIMHYLEYLLNSLNIVANKSLFNIEKINKKILPEYISLKKSTNDYFSIDVEGNKCKPTYLFKNGVYSNIICDRKTADKFNLSGADSKYNYFLNDILITPGQLTLDISLPYSNNYSVLVDYIDTQTKFFDFVSGRFEFTMYGLDILENKYKSYRYKGNIIDLLSRIKNISSDKKTIESYTFNEVILDFEVRRG